MNKKSKLSFLVIALVLYFSVFTAVTVFAVPEDDTAEEPVASETEYVSPDTEYVAPETETEYVPPETETEYVPPQTYAPETEAQDYTPEETYYSDDEDNYDYNNSYNYEERESNTTSEKAETAAVYDAERDDVSTDTLKKGDWAKIAALLKNSNGDEGDDFAFIRNNDPNSGNNGEWMLILGILMEAAGLGITVFLFVVNNRRKNAVKAGVGGRHPAERNKRDPRAAKHPRRAERAPARHEFTRKQRSKFDTADIAVPGKNGKSGEGKKYRPKH